MNQEEMIRLQKIEKREKFDLILAYILLVFLSLAILFILYLKFIRREPIEEETEYTPNYISLEEVSNSLNSSILANRFSNDNAVFASTVVGDSIVVNYSKEEVDISLNIPKVDNELQVSFEKENSDIITDISKEISVIVCNYYNKDEEGCRSTIDNIYNTNEIEGIRYFEDNGTVSMYIDVTRKITLNNNIYSEETIMGINNTDYTLKISDTRISNISINSNETNIIFTGTIINNLENSNTASVVVKLYDSSNNVIGENKKEFTTENPLEGSSNFEVSFTLDDTLKLESITHYSISVVR